MESQQSSDIGGAQPQKMCKACFAVIHPQAEICPKCGTRQFSILNKTVLVLLTFFFGGMGVHKFYVGKIGQGVLYLLFCWTLIPSIIALVEFFIYIFADEKQLQLKYPDSSGVRAALALVIGGVGVMVVISVTGIIAAISIPAFFKYQGKAACAIVEVEAEQASNKIRLFLLDTGSSQVPTLSELNASYGYTPNDKVAIEIGGTAEKVIIKASDKSEKCMEGQYYILTIPEDLSLIGWQ